MAGKSALRAVAPDEKPAAKKPPLTLAQAVELGDYREILLAQQREIASTVGEEKGPAKAALHRQLSAISKELQALNAAAKEEATENGESTPDEQLDASAF